MSEQEITAEALDMMAGMVDDGLLTQMHPTYIRRAARTIRRLEGEVAELRGRLSTYVAEVVDTQADAELGSLVRRIREHPEMVARQLTLSWHGHDWHYAAYPETLEEALRVLDTLTTRRAAEEGERGPSGLRYRMKDGKLETDGVQISGGTTITSAFRPCCNVPTGDLDVVERVRKGVPRGE